MNYRRQGTRIDKIPAEDFVGLFFIAGVLLITLIGVPESRPILGVVLPAGASIAALRYWWLNQTRF
jgi:hypothetical protein